MKNYTYGRISKLPKIELHLHLEGAVRLKTLKELSCRPNLSCNQEEADKIRKIDKYDGLSHFVLSMRTLMDTCLRTPEDYERIAYELFADLAGQNVRYAEVSYDPTRGLRLGISFSEIISSVYKAKIKAEKDHPIKVGLIIGLGRERESHVVAEFARLAANSQHLGIVGLDLHGNEEAAPPENFIEAYDIARKAGLGLRAHAGEGTGPQSIWSSIKSLGVTRVGHGVRAIEDESLVEYLRHNPITLDMCPSSNYKLGIIQSLSEHPIRRFFDLGIRVSVSTDDPFFFDTTMTKEYQILIDRLGFTLEELKQITIYAVDAAFLGEPAKSDLRRQIEMDFV